MPKIKKVTEWTRPECRRVTEAVNKALDEVGRKHGINIQRSGNGSFNESNFTFKVECALIGNDGMVRNKEVENFKKFATSYGLKPEHLGKSFKGWNGETFTISGLNTRAHKNPIQATNSKGKTYVFPEGEVQNYLEKA